MRPKSILLLVLALGCGLVASIGISQVMDRRGSGGDDGERVEVLVAKVEIQAGEAIKPEMVALQKVPKELVAADTLTKIEEVDGKKPNGKLLVGEIIRQANLGEGSAAPIPPGFRVNTIRATADRGGNLLKPGDRVDVQVYVRANAVPQITEPTLQTFLTDVSVYAVDTKTSQSEEEQGSASTRTVSLLVTPDQAGKLTYASQIGQIQLVMRGAGDTSDTSVTESISWNKLVNSSESPGDRKANGKKTDIAAAAADDGESLADRIQRELDERMKKFTAATANNAVAPPNNQFVMLEVRGQEFVQYTFADPTKPPIGWGPVDGAAVGSAPAPAMPAYEPPVDDAPQLRMSPLRPDRTSQPAERYEEPTE
ncbi:MAG: Flp pilus assembly protein CpaB [Pirellulales bacterium]